MRDRETPDEEFTHVHAMDGTLVFAEVGGAHQEFSGGYARELRRRSKGRQWLLRDLSDREGISQRASIVRTGRHIPGDNNLGVLGHIDAPRKRVLV